MDVLCLYMEVCGRYPIAASLLGRVIVPSCGNSRDASVFLSTSSSDGKTATMGKEDYASTGISLPRAEHRFQANTQEGGSLRLKGAKDSGIKKKKKKSRDKTLAEAKSGNPDGERAVSSAAEENESDRGKGKEPEGSGEQDDDDDGIEKGAYYAGKTEAERRFEERKRKRVGSLSLAGFCAIAG